MSPTYSVKNGIRYRYYLSKPITEGEPDNAAKLNRVPAAEVEKLVIEAIRSRLAIKRQGNTAPAEVNSPSTEQELIATHLTRVDVRRDHLAVQISPRPNTESEVYDQQAGLNHKGECNRDWSGEHHKAPRLRIPWKKSPSKRPRELIAPSTSSSRRDSRPIRAETRAKLVTAIARGRRWLDELIAGGFTNVEQIAAAHDCTTRQVNMTISLAFLAPTLVQAAVDGRLPRGIGVAALRDAPPDWTKQHAMLGLTN